MARIPRPNMIRPAITGPALVAALPVIGGALAALVAAGFFAILPDWRLEALVEASGLPRLLPLAQPPLGLTARGLLALTIGAVTGAVTWSALFLLVEPGGLLAPRAKGEGGVPVVRRADAHPDAPPRRPLSAAELGTPPAPPQVAEEASPSARALPADLEQPLAAFDPQAIPDVPREPVRPVRPVAPPPAPSAAPPPPAALPAAPPVAEARPDERADERPDERIETFELTPMVRRPDRRPAPEPAPSIEALLQRLERGTRRSGTS